VILMVSTVSETKQYIQDLRVHPKKLTGSVVKTI